MPKSVWHVQLVIGGVAIAVAIPLIAYLIWIERNER